MVNKDVWCLEIERAPGTLDFSEPWIYEIGHPRRDLLFWQAAKEQLKDEFAQEEIWIIQYEGRLV